MVFYSDGASICFLRKVLILYLTTQPVTRSFLANQ